MANRTSGTANLSLRIVPIIAFVWPSLFNSRMFDSMDFLSFSDHIGGYVEYGLDEPLDPFPPECMRDI